MEKFIPFLFAGGGAAFLNWSSRFLFSLWFNYETAIVLAFFVGLASGFVLMRSFVFEGSKKSVVPQIGTYLAVNALALLQTLIVSVGLARWVLPLVGFTTNPEGIAHLAGVLVPVVTSYFGHKHFTFR